MDSRGFYFNMGILVFVLLLAEWCPNIAAVDPVTIQPFTGLECNCSEDCLYGLQTCELIRCKCPYNEGNYVANVNCSGELCPNNCCNLLPTSLRGKTATHFMHSELYTNYNESESTRVLMVFTKLASSTTPPKWIMTLITEERRDGDDVRVLENIFLSEADTDDSLDKEGEIPAVFQEHMDNLEDSQSFSEPLQCSDELNTSCHDEFCSCLLYPKDKPEPLFESFTNITDSNIVYEISNNFSTLKTSSDLFPLDNIDVLRNTSCTLGGWAPSFNDNNPYIQFTDVQGDVCGVVIQGAEWSTSRRLEKFTVETESGDLRSLDGTDHFLSGVVLYTKSVHLFATPAKEPQSLKINVVEPTDPLKVGFRASLIMCGRSAVSSCHENTFVEDLSDEIANFFDKTEVHGDSPWRDPIGLVSEFYHSMQNYLKNEFDHHASPGEKRSRKSIGNVEIEVYIVRIKDLEKKGYTFNSTQFDSPDSFHFVHVNIPPGGVVPPNDSNPEVVLFASVAYHDDSRVHTDINDDERIRYKIVSPIVTTRVFINGTECEEVVKEIEVIMQYKKITPGRPEALYFKEECVNRSSGKHVFWSKEGCTAVCNKTASFCEIKCNHTTSFAVLQLVGESKLSDAGKLAASILTTVGSVISILSLVAALFIYFLLRSSIANAQYAIHSNLMISLLISLCIFLTLQIPRKRNVWCKVTMFSLQYFFSAAFCWMLCEGIHLYRQIITVFESGSKHIQMYFLLGWVVPISFVVVSMLGITIREARYPNKCCRDIRKPCFFSHGDGSIWYFVVPVLVVILINTGILVMVTIVVVRAAKVQADKDSSQAFYQVKAGLRSALLLFPLLGCSYIIGFFASVHGSFEIMYDIINSLQGFFLAMFYCVMNKEVRGAIGKYIKRSRDMSSIQASTTGTNVNKSYTDASKAKRKNSKLNQVEPAEEVPLKQSQLHLQEVD